MDNGDSVGGPPVVMTMDEGEQCQDCAGRYLTVYRLPDDVWARITPKPEHPEGGLLCPPCADRRAAAAGIPLYWTAKEHDHAR